jgi:methylated-DNA-[protein]-cysteine S-methyltransferase
MSATLATAWSRWESPIGELTLVAGEGGLAAIHFPNRPGRLDPAARNEDALEGAAAQLAAYFAAERRRFDLDLAPRRGTDLERAVWSELERIPYGETVSYGELAERVGHVGDHERIREVAAIVGRTPTPIVVPCHRVVGADGSLTGYGGGIERKRALLDLERRAAAGLPHQPPWEFRQPTLI